MRANCPGKYPDFAMFIRPALIHRLSTAAAKSVDRPSLASLVAKLRTESGQSFSLCRKALEKADMDLEKARIELSSLVESQAQGTQTAGLSKKQNQGLIGVVPLDSRSYGLVEMRCLSDFVAKNPLFGDLASTIAQSLNGPSNPKTIQAHLEATKLDKLVLETVGKLKEPITVLRLEKIESESDETLGAYVHKPVFPGFGSIISVVGLKGISQGNIWAQTLASNIAKQVAGLNPETIQVLLEQEYLFDPSVTIHQLIQKTSHANQHSNPITASKMIRYSL